MTAAFWQGFGWVTGAGLGLVVVVIVLVAVGRFLKWTEGSRR